MSTELARQDGAQVAQQQPGTLTEDQVQLLKDTVCKGATDNELRLFMQVCTTKRLDPFSKQIHAVKRPVKEKGEWREVMSFQTGIDGYRLIAERTGQYAGQDQPQWCGEDGEWKEVWFSSAPPVAARAAVYRHGFEKPMVRIARWTAYVQTMNGDGGRKVPNSMWSKMGPEQLHKCAEALALRAAFPEELSGLYTSEEMGQSDSEPEPTRAEKAEAAQAVAAAKLAAMKGEPPPVHDAEFVDEPPMISAPVAEMEPRPQKIAFAALDKFKVIKKELDKLGAEARYYGVLQSFGAEKANGLTDANEAKAYKALGEALQAIRLEVADREETDKGYAALVAQHKGEVDRLIGVFSYESWDAVPLAERDDLLAKLRKELA